MNYSKLFLTLLGTLLFVSCIPRKDLIYLQNDKDKVDTNTVSPVLLKPYRLQVNDQLSITIKANDSKLVEMFSLNSSANNLNSEPGFYFSGYTVSDHGTIRVPVLGEIEILGKTLDEVRIIVEEKLLKDYFTKEAGMFVTVKLSGFRFTINGEIGSTGTKVMLQERLNILEAIANSGDITITGNRKDVIVMRRFPQGTETFHIDLTSANAVNSPVYNLQPNDYIYVKPVKQKTWGTGKTGLESFTTIVSVISLGITTYLILRN